MTTSYQDYTLADDAETFVRTDEHGRERELCECVYEVTGHMEGDGECPYGPYATTPHPDGAPRYQEED